MRIVHFADLHLGVENYGRIDPRTGLSTRLGDFLAAFDQVVDYAVAEGADLVLFCGDAYKSHDPSQTHQRELAQVRCPSLWSPDAIMAPGRLERSGDSMKYTRITVDPGHMGGVPCLRGLRIPVATIVEMMAQGMTEDAILEAYPDLEREDLREALRYAAAAVRERELPLASGA